MKSPCEDHPRIGESELIRNQCPRCVADLRAQVATFIEEEKWWASRLAKASDDRDAARAQGAELTAERDELKRWWVTAVDNAADALTAMHAADAQVAQLTKEKEDMGAAIGFDYAEMKQRLATLTEQLERIGWHEVSGTEARDIARAALAQQPEATEPPNDEEIWDALPTRSIEAIRCDCPRGVSGLRQHRPGAHQL